MNPTSLHLLSWPTLLAAAGANAVPPRVLYTALAVAALSVLFRIRRGRVSRLHLAEMALGACASLAVLSALILMPTAPAAVRYAVLFVGFALALPALIFRLREKNSKQLLKFLVAALAIPLLFLPFSQAQEDVPGTPLNVELIALASSVLSVSTICGFVVWKQQRAEANVANLAARLGWQVEVQTHLGGLMRAPSLTGKYRRRQLHCLDFNPKPAAGNAWVAVAAELSRGSETDLTLEAGARQIGKTPNIVSVDEEFDQRFRVESKDTGLAQELFASGFRQRVLDMGREPSAAFILAIRPGRAVYAIPGSCADEPALNHLAEKLDFICDFADAIERCGRETHSPLLSATSHHL